MRFRLKKTSDSGGDSPDPYVPGAEVVKRDEWAYPEYVQYITINTLEELLALGRVVVNGFKATWEGDDIEQVPIIELYDGYRE